MQDCAPQTGGQRAGDGRKRPGGERAEVRGRLRQVRQHGAHLLPLPRAAKDLHRAVLQLPPQLQHVPVNTGTS